MKILRSAGPVVLLAAAGTLIAGMLAFAPSALASPDGKAALLPAATDAPDGAPDDQAPQGPPGEPQDEDGQDGVTPPPDGGTTEPPPGDGEEPPGTPGTEGPPGGRTEEGSRTTSETTSLPAFEANLPFTGGKPVGFWILGGLLMVAGAATLTAPAWLRRTGKA